MPLPIIIVVERHWDEAPKKILMNGLNMLQTFGYDTLCFESPEDQAEPEIITTINSTIDFIQKRLAEANHCLKQQSISTDLTQMDYVKLQQLLYLRVSSKYSKEMALWFRELPGHQKKLALAKDAIDQNMAICGIDLPSEQLKQANSLEAQICLQTKLKAIDSLDSQRIAIFKDNLLKLQKQHAGLIFIVGQAHYSQLIEAFSKEQRLDDIIFLHPYTPECLASSHVDYLLPETKEVTDLTLIEQAITTSNSIEDLLTNLQRTIQSKLDSHIAVTQTATSQALSRKSDLSFEPVTRPGHLVDAYCFFSKKSDVEQKVNQLNAQGIFGFYASFKHKEAYCVANINTPEVAAQIHKN